MRSILLTITPADIKAWGDDSEEAYACVYPWLTSAVDIAARRYWFVPVRWLMKDQFRSDLRVGKVAAPVLVLHGERDAVVPIALGERLYALINAPKRFVRFPGAGHNDLGASGAVATAKTFLAEKSP